MSDDAKKLYRQALRDPRWQRRRLEIMNRADFACEQCGSRERTLNVHHKIYRVNALPWEYVDAELECLCEDCHIMEHAPEPQGLVDTLLWKAANFGINRAEKAMLSELLQAPCR